MSGKVPLVNLVLITAFRGTHYGREAHMRAHETHNHNVSSASELRFMPL